jgi:CubicO group peptidase (beta-lactamase class C family)
MSRRFFVSALLPIVAATAVALPPAALAQTAVDLEALDAYIADAHAEWPVPGMAVAILKDDSVVFARGYGVREVGTAGRVDEHTLFAIASNTKAFTTAALARLVDQDLLDWNDRVVEHLPYFQVYSPYVTDEMRVRDLVTHRSGFGSFSGDLVWYGTAYSREEVVWRMRFLDPDRRFRADFGYSNVMFLAAGVTLEAVTGRTWDKYLETEFFGPLGMDRTVTSIDSLANRSNVATPHNERDGRVMAFPWYPWDNAGPVGSIISSVSDMANWMRLQLNRGTGDGRTYFSREQSRTMWSLHTPLSVSEYSEARYGQHFNGYGLGWNVLDYHGTFLARHGGAADGMYSRVMLVPEENLGVVILTNGMTSLQTALSYYILDLYLGREPRDWSAEFLEGHKRGKARWAERWEEWKAERIPNTTPSLPLEEYTGTYGGDLYGDATVTEEDGRLVLRLLPNPDLVADLSHWHQDVFLITWSHEFPWFDDGWATFEIDHTGTATEIELYVPNEDFWFEELELERR